MGTLKSCWRCLKLTCKFQNCVQILKNNTSHACVTWIDCYNVVPLITSTYSIHSFLGLSGKELAYGLQ